jgi:outer membrane receptor protein involved in Fe transport
MKIFKKSAISAMVSSVFAATGATAVLVMPAYAQTAPADASAQANDKSDVANLNRVVVTASSGAKSKMRSSVSVTDVDQDQVKDLGAHSESEVLLLIPGVRTNPDAGPGGNSNITVRGLPISSGGSKYVQLQEDGLPTVQFGDMNFSNNDYWIRFDNNVDHIQTLRGGSSSVFASQAPGAVINYISKTGKETGGSVGLTRGLNYNETRFDGDFGAHITPDLYYHVGGYFREGEGARHTTDNALQGYQLKGNITKEFNGGKGYVRLNFKFLDEHAPTTPQTFLNASQSGSTVSGFSKSAGYDATRDSQYSLYNATVPYIDPVTHQVGTTSLTKGITVDSKSVGFEYHDELAGGFSVDNKFRVSKNAGAFNAQFWNLMTLNNMLTGFGNGATTAKYYNGPNAGAVVSGANLPTGLVSQGAAINVQTPDMGNLVNDFSVNKQFKIDTSTLDVRAGMFHSRQNVVQRWMISERVVAAGRDGAVIDVFNGAGTALTTAGLTGYNNQWGGCCARDIDANFTTNAPYLSLSMETGDLNVDAGFRRESFTANGSYVSGKSQAYDVNHDGQITGAENNVYLIDPNAPRGLVNYTKDYNNYSLGANYRLTPDLSGFARYSKGNRAIADRLLFSSNIDAATGALSSGGQVASVAPVKQSEIGVKNRGRADWGSYGVSLTYFHSTTTEFDYDQTRQDNPNLPNFQGPKLNVQSYKADGVELESVVGFGALSIAANLVYEKEEITGDLGNPASIGKEPAGVPKIRYTISPRYTLGAATFGAVLRGNGEQYNNGGNTVKIDGHYVINAFVNYDFGNGLIGAFNVANLLDKVYPTSTGGFVAGSSSLFGAGMETGRLFTVSMKYQF